MSTNDMFGVEIPFATHCGIKAVVSEPGFCRLSLAMREEHQNHLGIMHGGVALTMLDVAMGSAARLWANASVMTVDMQSAFLSPGRGDLIAEGRVLRPGRSLIFCEGEVRDAAGTVVVKASGLFKIAKATPAESAAAG